MTRPSPRLLRSGGAVLVFAGLMACPQPERGPTPPSVDPNPVIGDHTERHDPGAPWLDETRMSAQVLPSGIQVVVPMSRAPGQADHAPQPVQVEVSLVDGCTEQPHVTTHQTVNLDQQILPVAVDLVAREPLFNRAEGPGALARYIVVVEAREGSGTRRVRRDLLRILNVFDFAVTAPEQVVAGGNLAVHVSARDAAGSAAKQVPVRATLSGQTMETTTDDQGAASMTLTAPADGSTVATLQVEWGEQGAMGTWEGTVRLAPSRNILLTTDKPRYHPGQPMHLRALVVKDGTGGAPQAYQGTVVFMVRDAKGNVVFRQSTASNNFGVASASLMVGPKVNDGTWTVRVESGAGGRTEAITRTLTVEDHPTPVFRVELDAAPNSVKPHEPVVVNVHAEYAPGIPVSKGMVHLEGSMQGHPVVDSSALLDDHGNTSLSLQAPPTLEGQATTLDLRATVTDGEGGSAVEVAVVSVVPEKLVVQTWWERPLASIRGSNRLFVLLTDASGNPLTGSIEVQRTDTAAFDSSFGVNELGLAVIEFAGLSQQGFLFLDCRSGALFERTLVSVPTGSTGMALSIDPPVIQEGEPLTVYLFSPGSTRATVDVYAGGSLVDQLAVSLDGEGNGLGVVSNTPGGILRLIAQAAQTHAVGEAVAYAWQDRSLRVRVTSPSSTVRPGEPALLSLDVTDEQGRRVPAALGVTAADDRVYPLTRLDQVVSSWAQGTMLGAPRGLSVEQALAKGASSHSTEAVLAWNAGSQGGVLHTDLGPLTRQRAVAAATTMVMADAEAIREAALAAGFKAGATSGNELATWLSTQGFLDPWGNPYRFTGNSSFSYVTLLSWGPDESRSQDDIQTYVYLVGQSSVSGTTGGSSSSDQVIPGNSNNGDSSGPSSSSAPPLEPFQPPLPDTRLSVPVLLTPSQGSAQVPLETTRVPTAWRVEAVGTDMEGRVGVGSTVVRTFKEFMVELDVPAVMSVGDEVSATAIISNFLPTPQTVTLFTSTGAWAQISNNEQVTVTVPPLGVVGVPIPITAALVGQFTLVANARGVVEDETSARVQVVPTGHERPFSHSNALAEHVEVPLDIPLDAQSGHSELTVRLLPGMEAELVNGLDGLSRMVAGSAEQAVSITSAHALLLAHLRATGQSRPELVSRAVSQLEQGYQRLVTFRLAEGGFSWFGRAPADVVLTAFALMGLLDLAQELPVDGAVLDETANALAAWQLGDGSYARVAGLGDASFEATAHAAWALARHGEHGSAVQRARQWLEAHVAGEDNPYSLAVYGNLLAAVAPNTSALDATVAGLLSRAHEQPDMVSFAGTTASALAPSTQQGGNPALEIETTALVALALLKGQRTPEMATKALTFLMRNKDGFGTWHNTQATLRALQALQAGGVASDPPGQGTITVKMDDNVVGIFQVTPENAAVPRVVNLSTRAAPGHHVIVLDRTGVARSRFQVAGRTFGPSNTQDPRPLSVSMELSNPAPRVGEAVRATVDVLSSVGFSMLVVDIPIFPGFALDPTRLQTSPVVESVEHLGTRLLVFTRGISQDGHVVLDFFLRPCISSKVLVPPIKAYAAYNPFLAAEAVPRSVSVP